MGSVFTYISDNALANYSPETDECPVCAELKALYPLLGFLIKPDGSYDDEDPDSEISVACANCINSERIARFEEYEFDGFLQDCFENWMELRRRLRTTPQIPLMMQRADWAFCCNDLCEFTGSPRDFQDLLRLVQGATYWDRISGNMPRNFKDDGPPESLREISAFRCMHCPKTYWIDQFT